MPLLLLSPPPRSCRLTHFQPCCQVRSLTYKDADNIHHDQKQLLSLLRHVSASVASLSETNRVFWKNPGRTLGRAVSCVFSLKNTWSCEFDLRVLPALFPYLPSAAVNQVSGRGRVSRGLPLLRTGRRARLSAEGSTNCTQVLHVDWTINLISTLSL